MFFENSQVHGIRKEKKREKFNFCVVFFVAPFVELQKLLRLSRREEISFRKDSRCLSLFRLFIHFSL